MPVTPEDTFNFALSIKDDSNEASMRAVVSRIYYSFYYSCCELSTKLSLPEPPYSAKTKGVHDNLIKKFTTYNQNSTEDLDRTIRRLGIMMGQMKSYRTEADYAINLELPSSHTELVIAYSDKLFEVIETINSLNNV